MKSWIYKIVKDGKVIYVGSCTREYFCQRKGDHTKPTTLKKESQPKLQHYVRDNGGWDTFIFEIIKEYETISKHDLLTEEKEYIISLNPLCNSTLPIETKEELLERKRVYRKQYYEKNPEQLVKHTASKKLTDSYKENVEKRCSTHIQCECGGTYTLQNKTNHFKRNIHISYETSKNSTV